MTYNVFSGTLNPTHLTSSWAWSPRRTFEYSWAAVGLQDSWRSCHAVISELEENWDHWVESSERLKSFYKLVCRLSQLDCVDRCRVIAVVQGVVTAAISLLETLAQKNPDEYKGCVPLAVSRLSRVILHHDNSFCLCFSLWRVFAWLASHAADCDVQSLMCTEHWLICQLVCCADDDFHF